MQGTKEHGGSIAFTEFNVGCTIITSLEHTLACMAEPKYGFNIKIMPNGDKIILHPEIPPHKWDGEKFVKIEFKEMEQEHE